MQQKFSEQSEMEVQDCLRNALSALNTEMNLPQISMQYAALCIPNIVATILNAVKLKTLDKVFLLPAYPEQEPQIVLSYGDRMSDREYQKLVGRILQSDNSEEKIALIFDEIHSLADLLDILSDSELCADDFCLLVSKLPLPVFVLLLSQYPNDDFLERESEQQLFVALQERKQQLSAEERQQVERMVKPF